MTGRWKGYPAYQGSGVEWLGDVPRGWTVRPLKHSARMNSETLPETTDPDWMIRYIEISGVDSLGRVSETEEVTFGKAPSRARRVVRSGDTLISTVRTYLKAITHFQEAPDNLIASTGFAVLRPLRKYCVPEFLAWAVRSDPFVAFVIANSEGVGYPAIAPGRLAALKLAIPGKDEQRAIAAFLDRETARIDALIAKKEHVIELLREQRTATISKLVTGGLDAAAPRRPSTVAWIGTIPAHWEVWRLKHCCKLETGHTPNRATAEYWVPEECTIPWVSLNDSKQLARVDVIEETAFCISPHGMANSSAHLLPAGAVAFTRDATIGLAAILGKPMAVSQHVIAWVCGPKMYNWYVLYAMYAMRPALEEFTAGSTLRTIGMPDVNRLACPVPPLDEQKAIVARIKAELLGIDSLLGRQEATLRLLREQRQALITAAVTGQIDVRGEVVLPEGS